MTTVAGVNSSVTYIYTDGLGSPLARTDANGKVISQTRYEPYGYVASGAQPTIGFTGHVNDVDTGLTYMQQRYYDPVAGRFLSIDPVATDSSGPDGFNRYAYANNSPYKYVDPDGRFAFMVHWEITYLASRAAGNSFSDSLRYANRALMTDFDKGSQLVTKEATAIHAMRIVDEPIPEARQRNKQVVEDSIASGDLGKASHAIQDRFAGGHANFNLWEGFTKLGVWGTIKHIAADTFPSPMAISGAYSETKNMFETNRKTESKGAKANEGNNSPRGSGNNAGGQGCMASNSCWW
jgi:RHS repeat-associated protein